MFDDTAIVSYDGVVDFLMSSSVLIWMVFQSISIIHCGGFNELHLGINIPHTHSQSFSFTAIEEVLKLPSPAVCINSALLNVMELDGIWQRHQLPDGTWSSEIWEKEFFEEITSEVR